MGKLWADFSVKSAEAPRPCTGRPLSRQFEGHPTEWLLLICVLLRRYSPENSIASRRGLVRLRVSGRGGCRGQRQLRVRRNSIVHGAITPPQIPDQHTVPLPCVSNTFGAKTVPVLAALVYQPESHWLSKARLLCTSWCADSGVQGDAFQKHMSTATATKEMACR